MICRSRWIRLLLCTAILLVACGQGEGEGAGEGELVPIPEEEIQRLESLGYLDYAPADTQRESTNVISPDAPPSYPGYDLFTVSALHKAVLRDLGGRVIRTWHGDQGLWERATLTPSGELLVVARLEGKRLLARYAWEGTRLWTHVRDVHHHAIERADGNISLLTSQMMKLSKAPGARPILNNWLVIMTSEGKKLQGQSITAMLASRPDLFSFEKQTHASPDLLHANYFDWMWSDALAKQDPLYARSNVVVTIREQDTVAVFDYDAGKLVWAWGRGELIRPHEASVLCNGNFLVFDNRKGEDWSRVIEVNPLSREIEWEYHAEPRKDLYSATRGTAQRLPNGNTLIGVSNQGRAIEVAPDGTLVWEFLGPDSDAEGNRATIRVNRYESEFIEGLIARDGRAGPAAPGGRMEKTLAVGCPRIQKGSRATTRRP